MFVKKAINILLLILLVLSWHLHAFSQEGQPVPVWQGPEPVHNEVTDQGMANEDVEPKEEIADEESEYYDPSLKELLTDPNELLPTTPLRLTLEDCIRIALEHNSKLQATGYGIDAARAQLKEASVGGWPILEYEYMSAPVPANANEPVAAFFSGDMAWWNKVRIAMGLPVYSFGKISLAKEMAKSGINAAETLAFQEKNSLVSKVRQLYYGVLLAEEVGRLLREAHDRLQDEVEKRKTKEGEEIEHSPIESLKLKVFLFDLEKRLAETRHKQSLALEGLRVQMGLAAGTVFTVYSNKLRPVSATLKPFEDYLAVAKANRPDIKLLETGLDVKRNQYLFEKRKLWPDIGIGGFLEIGRTVRKVRNVSADDAYDNPFEFSRVGFGMRLSGKFDFHGSAARIDKSRSEYYKLNLEQMIAKEAIGLDVKDAFLKAKTAEGNLARAEEAEKTSRQLLFLTRSNYEIGVGEQKDMVDALQMVLMTRGRYFEAVFDYNSALASLDEKIGVVPEVKK